MHRIDQYFVESELDYRRHRTIAPLRRRRWPRTQGRTAADERVERAD